MTNPIDASLLRDDERDWMCKLPNCTDANCEGYTLLLRRLVEARSKLKRSAEIVAHCLTPWDSFTRGEYKELTELLEIPVREPR